MCVAFCLVLPGKREMGGGPNGFHDVSGDNEVSSSAGKIKYKNRLCSRSATNFVDALEGAILRNCRAFMQ